MSSDDNPEKKETADIMEALKRSLDAKKKRAGEYAPAKVKWLEAWREDWENRWESVRPPAEEVKREDERRARVWRQRLDLTKLVIRALFWPVIVNLFKVAVVLGMYSQAKQKFEVIVLAILIHIYMMVSELYSKREPKAEPTTSEDAIRHGASEAVRGLAMMAVSVINILAVLAAIWN